MNRFLRLALVTAALAAPSAASAQSLPQIWSDFYQGCTGSNGTPYLCACAATEYIVRCQAQGARSPGAVQQCIAANQNTWSNPVAAACQDRSRLQPAPRLQAPRPLPVQAGGETMTRGQVWDAAFQGCTQRQPDVYMCACVATLSAATCAPLPSVPASHVQACMPAAQPQITRSAMGCTSFGALTVNMSRR